METSTELSEHLGVRTENLKKLLAALHGVALKYMHACVDTERRFNAHTEEVLGEQQHADAPMEPGGLWVPHKISRMETARKGTVFKRERGRNSGLS